MVFSSKQITFRKVRYNITNFLTNVTSSNSDTEIVEGDTYQTTLTPESGYTDMTVSVTMGGVDITASSYSNGSVNISKVTGDIVVTATATAKISISITGSGNSSYCYATINGNKRYGAGTYEVVAGDEITFGVYGRSSSYYGDVKIDGTQVLKVTNQTTQTYSWTVPSGISSATISMSYTSTSSQRRGRITVTTA